MPDYLIIATKYHAKDNVYARRKLLRVRIVLNSAKDSISIFTTVIISYRESVRFSSYKVYYVCEKFLRLESHTSQ